MQDTNRWIEDNWLGNPMQYRFSNGSIIEFKAFDTIGKAKAAGKRDRLFLNEANHIPFEIADALIIRSKETWIDFNPDNEFWAHTEVLPEPNSEFLLLTYRDNEGCPIETIEDLEIKMQKAFYNPLDDWNDKSNVKNSYWANWCRVYIAGEIGILEGVIFQNWKTIDNLPSSAKYLGSGMDFGFTNDPTTLVDLYSYDNQFIFDEQIYQRGLTNGDIARLLKSLDYDKYNDIYADSSEPKSIQEINEYGFAVKGAKKGADSIMFGIDILQSNNFLVTSRSSNIIAELRKYGWDKDRNGVKLNKPIDAYNHSIDAMRYIATEKMSAKKPLKIQITIND